MLFDHYSLQDLSLNNRIVMPPMTRSRAGAGDVATDQMAEYYAQRASAGLIISEGTQISHRDRVMPGRRASIMKRRSPAGKKSPLRYTSREAKFLPSSGT